MDTLIYMGVVLGFVAIFTILVWLKIRKTFREAKNIERGLKMIPLLIHLPPSSDDVEAGSRDSRDVTNEAISRAETLYDIIASTAQKANFKSRLYGQRHIAFEIVGTRGRIYFYAAVPVPLVDIVKQAVISAYPTARLEEVSEHNIFNPVGKITGTIGGELVLKESYVHPIATYQDSKRDAIQSILSSLADLGPEDGAGIQLLIRPAKPGWSKASKETAKNKREGKDNKVKVGKVLLSWVKQLFTALWQPPEEGSSEGKAPKQLGSLEQSHVDAIEAKTQHAGYETLIRVMASSNVSMRAQSILRNIVAAFSLFDAPGKNGFKFNEAKDIENFVTAYILRFFPQEIDQNVLNSVELATVFHFPDDRDTPTSQVDRQAFKQVDGPRNMPTEGAIVGYNVFRGVKREVRISDNDRARHVYVVGQTGTGKSTMLENMIVQDMLNGRGLCFVDPHGEAIDRLMGMVPKERVEDIIHFSPADTDYPMGVNMFEFDSPEQKDFLIQEAISMLYRLYDPQRQGIIGPRYEHIFRNTALLLMADPQGGTFVDIPKVLVDPAFMKEKLKHVTDELVLDFWTKEWPSSQRSNESGEVTSWVVSKFGAFVSNEMMRNIIGQTKSSFNLRQIMDEGKILFVNLSKGRTGELNSKLLGMIFVMKFQAAAMSRANIPANERRDFTLYVDEFQNFSTDSFATILSEARKYNLSLVVANQFISQLTDEIRDAVFGNVGTIVAYRTGVNDAEFLAKQFSPTFEVDDLVRIPNFNAVERLMMDNIPSQPFSIVALPPLGHFNPQLSVALKRLSTAKYGRPKTVVEQEIYKRLKSPAPSIPAFGPQSSPFGPSSGLPKPAGSSGSFLDDWLAKRRQEVASKGATPARPPVSARDLPLRPPMPSLHDLPSLKKDKHGLPIPESTVSTSSFLPEARDLVGKKVDKSDIADISKVLKEKLGTDGRIKPADKVTPKPGEIALPASENEIVIDQEGKLHYKRDAS